MKVPNCPKKLHECSKMCVEYPCWAYNEYMDRNDKNEKERNQGWE